MIGDRWQEISSMAHYLIVRDIYDHFYFDHPATGDSSMSESKNSHSNICASIDYFWFGVVVSSGVE